MGLTAIILIYRILTCRADISSAQGLTAPGRRREVLPERPAQPPTTEQPSQSGQRGLPLTPSMQLGPGASSGRRIPGAAPAQATHWTSSQASQASGPGAEVRSSAESFSAVPRRMSQSSHTSMPYATSPSSASHRSFPSPSSASGPPGLVFQRPLPATESASGAVNPVSAQQGTSPVDQSNPWQHHHYIAPSTSAAFASQQTDRYVCDTCNKAFSRPSSLRIHSHSHTGEKPFKCPHAGCGKAFSVRSNMKRHERGCHTGMP